MAPTEWEEREGEGYPTTTTVTGFCNANPYEMDESRWEWGECEEDINFNELWFAVRGGGGGTYGIVTSLHYQLHDYPGQLVVVGVSPDGFPPEAIPDLSQEAAYVFTTIYVEFLLNYLWNPSLLNVTEAESRGCNSAQTINFNPFSGGNMFCYGTSGDAFVTTWQSMITSSATVQMLQGVGVPEAIIEALPNLFNSDSVFESYAHQALSFAQDLPGTVPEGRLPDAPQADVVPLLGIGSNGVDSFHVHFPIAAVVADPSGLAQLVALDVLTTGGGNFYALGGLVPVASDGLDSLAPTRRTSAFLRSVPDPGLRDTYLSFFFGPLDQSGDFPGSSCHNHALVYEMGPLKSNWSQSCPIDWPQAEREERCISQNEAAWGTANLNRLETLKAAIDPNNLFICTAGVGYSNPVMTDDDEGATSDNGDATAAPSEYPPDSASENIRFISAWILAGIVAYVFLGN